MSLRVVLTSAYCWPEVCRGGERYLHELAAALRRAGHDARIFASAPRERNGEVLGVPVRALRRRALLAGRFGDLAGEAGFGAQMLARGPSLHADVWHAMTTADAAAAAATGGVRRRLRTVFTDHGYPAAASRSRRPDVRLHRYVVDHVGAYVCVSRAAARYLADDFGRVATVVPPGVRLADYRPADRHWRPALLYAGSLTEPRKNVPAFLAAAARLAASGTDLEVWLHGPGDPGAVLAAAGPAANLVTRCEPLRPAELARAYAAAWVTVLPSVAESFGMVVIESLASGTPVVVRADSGGPAEVVVDDRIGRCASGEVDSLADACSRALELATRPSTAEACRAHAEPYDWDRHVVPALLDVYAGARRGGG